MKVVDCEQGTDLWYATRAGKCTGSRLADVTAKGKNGAPSATRANYLADLVSERLTGKPVSDKFESQAMRDGKEREATARSLHAFMHDVTPQKVGFVLHPTIEMSGVSPDSLIAEDGMAQYKCPYTSTHISWLRGAPIDGKYIKQIQFEMATCERRWSDFVSFCPFLPPEMQLFTRRIHRDDKLIAELEREVRIFLNDVDEAVAELRRLYLSDAKAA